MSGKRESTARRRRSSRRDGWWARHKAWVAGLNRGQKIRYRLLQVLAVVAIVVIAVAVGLKSWMKLPDIPVMPDGGNGDSSAYDGAELPDVAKSGRRKGYTPSCWWVRIPPAAAIPTP